MIKKIFTIISFFVLLFSFFQPLNFAQAQEVEKKVNIYFFWGNGCPHCAKEEVFLEELQKDYKNIEVFDFEVWYNRNNQKLFVEIGDKIDFKVTGVPVTIIGEKVFSGFSETITSQEIEKTISFYLNNEYSDPAKEIITNFYANNEIKPEYKIFEKVEIKQEPKEEIKVENSEEESILPEKVNFPLIGEIETKNLSLPIFTIVLGTLDGFNPCAMWVLLFLITLLLGMENKRRMWILGSAFIVASASVYFIFMAAWLNLILFLGFIIWIRILIGLIALVGGGYNLREYFKNKNNVCKVTESDKQQKTFEKLKSITQKRNFWLALGGIILLAFAVNLVELVCSAGLPAVYTQVLALSGLSKLQYYLYLLLYIFFFMVDDLIVFFIAMITLKATGITTKYTRASHLIGGILMIIIGILLIFKYEWLTF